MPIWGRFSGYGELILDLLLATAQASEFVGTVPGCTDPGLSSQGLRTSIGCLAPQFVDRVWEPMHVSLKTSDEVGGIAAVEVASEEADLDVSVRQGDSDLVLDRGDGLRGHGQSAEASDLGDWTAGLGRCLVQTPSKEALEMLAGVDSLGVGVAVDGHREPLAAGVGDAVQHPL